VPAIWRLTPRQSVAAECGRRGEAAVVAGCIDLLQGRPGTDDALLIALAGPAAQAVLDGAAGGKDGYWPRVWAARGLLYAWDDRATMMIIQATADDAWRVREMAAKVIARHRVGDALPAVSRLHTDPVQRVRAAAERAVVLLTETSA
jgi:HEAT repeat protein